MQTDIIFSGLLLCVLLALPQYTSAASFCATSPDGNIRVDDCNYDSYDECKRANGIRSDCIANHEEKLSTAKVATYCIVTWSTECKYYDYETCAKAAKSQMGFCYLNPDYKNPNE